MLTHMLIYTFIKTYFVLKDTNTCMLQFLLNTKIHWSRDEDR